VYVYLLSVACLRLRKTAAFSHPQGMCAAGDAEGGRSLAPSRYVEDLPPRGHSAVWGSWYCTQRCQWGFACCRSTNRSAAGCCPDGSTASEVKAQHVEIPLRSGRPGAAAAAAETKLMQMDAEEWRPREAFGTAEGFVAHGMRFLALRWAALLRDGSLPTAAGVKTLNPETSSVILSERVAADSVRIVEEFCGRLCERSLGRELVAKLEEICSYTHEREYAQASKAYMDVTIGSRRWLSDVPYSVSFSMQRQDTEVRWTPDCGSHPVDESGLRDHIVVLRRLLLAAQAAAPNDDPSKNCG